MTKAAAYGSRLGYGSVNKAFTVAAATNLVTATSHGLSANQPIMIVSSGYTAGTPLQAKHVYYTKTILTNTFELSLTPGGATIDVTVDGSGNYRALADIAQVSSLSGPDMEAATIDVTTHDSVSAIREFVSGLIDPGEFSGELVFDPNLATHIGLWNDLVNRVPGSFALYFPTVLAFAIGFEGNAVHIGPIEAQPDGAVTSPFTIKISGAPNVSQT